MRTMEKKKKMDERENQPPFDVSDDLKRLPLTRVDPPKTTENQLEKRNQSLHPDVSKIVARNANREHEILQEHQKLTKSSKNKSKKSCNENEDSIKNAHGGVADTMSVFSTGSNEVETERFTPELPDVQPQSSFIYSDIKTKEMEMCGVKIRECHMRSLKKYSTSNTKKEEEKNIPKDTLPKDSGSSYKNLVIIVCVVFLIYFCVVSRYSQPSISIKVLNVTAIVSQLKPEFKRQPDMSFTIIRSALTTVSKPRVSKTAISKSTDTSEPDAPAIILLLAAQGAEKLTSHLGRKLAETISDSPIHIQGSDFINQESNAGKREIDDRLKTLSTNSYDAVFVEDLHLIPGSIALMFHTYCDHENAPYKRVVYVMTVASESRIPNDSKGKFWDETVRTRLSKSWSDIDNDQMEPLLTRLTVGVAAIIADSN